MNIVRRSEGKYVVVVLDGQHNFHKFLACLHPDAVYTSIRVDEAAKFSDIATASYVRDKLIEWFFGNNELNCCLANYYADGDVLCLLI